MEKNVRTNFWNDKTGCDKTKCNWRNYNNDRKSKYQNQNPYLTLELEIWKKKLNKFVIFETQRQKQGYKLFETEKSFNFKYQNIDLKKIRHITRQDNNTLWISTAGNKLYRLEIKKK